MPIPLNIIGGNLYVTATIMKTYIVKIKQFAVMTGIALSGICGSSAVTPANALSFNFIPASGTSQAAIDGFTAAGNRWSSLFTDNVNINININFSALGSGILAQASSNRLKFSYTDVYNALNNDITSADDNTAVASLSNSATFNLLLNRTKNNPNGIGSATTYLDNDGDTNNQTLSISNANAKALGLATIGTTDAFISFSTGFTWDFDRTDGAITAGSYDFVGIAEHEIGHALGFTSGVDDLEYDSPHIDSHTGVSSYFNDDQLTFVNTLDLFRYSTESKNLSAIDWTADTRDKYFSIDGGATKIAAFSTGSTWGDGRQASHWQDNAGLGIMDPTIAPGELLQITENDLQAFDAIGWNRADNSTAVPEPSNVIGTFIFTAFGAKMVLKRRQKLLTLTEKATFEDV